jgi:assimilatory nitrate reductase catalytic subunit
MIVCHCQAVNDRAIRDAIQRGARSPRQVALACQAGRRCGGCIPVVRELLANERLASDPAEEALPAVAAS